MTTAARTSRLVGTIVRLLAGLAAGSLLLVLLDNALLLSPGSEGPDGDTIGTIITVLWFLGWAMVAVGIGALSEWIAGRLEVLVAVGSVAIGTALLWFLPPVFWLLNSYLGEPIDIYLGRPESLRSFAVILNIPVLLFALVGGTLVFFARRTDLR